MKIAVLVICIDKYICFWPGLYKSAKKFFLARHDRTFFVFSDHSEIPFGQNKDVILVRQENLGWPGNTLMRYEMFCRIEEQLKSYDMIFFVNANLLFIRPISDEILPRKKNLVFVKRVPPYLIKEKKLPYESNPLSTAYVSEDESSLYVRCGFNGGKSADFLQMCKTLRDNINADLQKGIIAVWHDESHITRYAAGRTDIKVLSPGYLYPDGFVMPYKKMILIRQKDNQYIRYGKTRSKSAAIKSKMFIAFRNAVYTVLIKLHVLKMEE